MRCSGDMGAVRKLTLTVAAVLLASAAVVVAKTSHAGWPRIDGKLIINSRSADVTMRGLANRHNELLGGDGNDTIYSGNAGDVIWGDYKPHTQPTGQVDRIYAGAGNDFIYTSHGTNYIYTGGGNDVVHAHFGRGEIHCQSPTVTVYLSRKSRAGYRLFGCTRISFATLGY